MNQEYKEYLVNQILAGVIRIKVDGKRFYLEQPTRLQKCISYELYQDTLSDCRYDGFLTSKSAKSFLSSSNIFTSEDQDSLDKLNKDVEECQFQLYTSRLNSEKVRFVRKTLIKVRKLISESLQNKHCLDYVTLEGYASYIKNQYIVHCGLRNADGSRVFADEFSLEKDYKLLEKVISEMTRSVISEKQLREIARTNPWRSYWGAAKEDVFGAPSADMTDNQKALILLTRMYDNARENPECPDDDVFEDDDMFDGWMTFVTRKRKKEKKEQEVDKMLPPKQRNAQELFLVSNSKDVQTINDLNGMHARMTKKQRKKVIEQKGSARDSDFLDNKLKIQQQVNRDFISNVKGKYNG